MNWSEMQTSWTEMSPLVQTHWPKLTHSVLNAVNGDRAALIRAIERHYGFSAADAEIAVCEFEKDVRRPGAVK
jgi:hypothetical protein